MGHARYVGRVGALAVALGVGIAVASPPGVAWAVPGESTNETNADGNASGNDGPNTSTTGNGETAAGNAGGVTGTGTGLGDPPVGGGNGNGNGNGTGAGSGATTGTGTANNGTSGSVTVAVGDSPPVTFSKPVVDPDEGSTIVVVPGGQVIPPADAGAGQQALQPPTGSAPIDSSANSKSSTDLPGGGALTPALAGNDSNTVGVQNFSVSRSPEELGVSIQTFGAPAGNVQTNIAALNAAAAPVIHPVVATPVAQPAPAPVAVLAGLPGAFLSLANGLISAVLAPFALLGGGPAGPTDTPLMWAVLAFVRRQFVNTTPRMNPSTTATDPTTGLIHGNLGATDADGDAMTFTVVGNPAHGGLLIDQATGNYTYTPIPGYAGTDTFVVAVTDSGPDGLFGFLQPGGGHTSVTAITITVDRGAPVNGAPTGSASATDPDPVTGTVTVTVTGSDPNGDVVAIAAPTSAPGILTPSSSTTVNGVTTATFSYTPNQAVRDAAAATQGTDTGTLVFTLSDPAGATALVTATFTVAPTPGDGLVGDPILLAGTPSYFRTSPDGTRLFQFSDVTDPVTGVQSTVLQIIDTTTGTQVGAPLTRPGQAYSDDLEFTADGTRAYLTTRSYGENVNTFTVLDVATGAEIGTPVSLSGYYLNRQFNADKSRVYLSSQAGSAGITDFVVVNTATGTIVGSRLTFAGDAYPDFSDDGTRAVFSSSSSSSGTATATVTVVDLTTGSIVGQPVSLTIQNPNSSYAYVDVRRSEDGSRVLLIGRGYNYDPTSLRIVDARTGTTVADDVLADRTFRRIDFNDDYSSAYLTTDYVQGTQGATFTVLDVASGAVRGGVVTIDGYLYGNPIFVDDHSRAILQTYVNDQAGGQTTTVTVVDTEAGRVIGQPVTQLGNPGNYVLLSEDGTRALSTVYRYANGTASSSLVVIDTQTGNAIGQGAELSGYSGRQPQIVGEYAYWAGSSPYDYYGGQRTQTTLAVLELSTGNPVGQQIVIDGSFDKLQFIGDRLYFTAERYNGSNSEYTTTLALIDADTGLALGQPVQVTGFLPEVLDFNQDKTRLFLQGRYSYPRYLTGELHIIDTETGALVGDSVLTGRTFQYASRNQDDTRVYLAEATNSGSVTFSILNSVDGSVIGTPVQVAGEYQSLQFDPQQAKAYLVTRSYDYGQSRYTTTIAVIDEATGALVNTPMAIDGTDYYGYLRFNDDGSRAVYSTSGLEYDPVLQADVYTRKVGLINGETATLIGSPVAVKEYNSYYNYGDVVFTEDGTRVHVVSYVNVTIPFDDGGGSYGTSVPAAVTTLNTQTGALVGPAIDLNSPTDDLSELVFNDAGTRAYVTVRNRVADTVTFRVFNLDTGVAAPAVVIPTAIDGYYDGLDVNKVLANGNRVVLVGVSDEGRTTTAVLVDTDTGLVVGAPVVLGGQLAYQSATLSPDESKLYLTTESYTNSTYVTHSVVVDTATGAVTDVVPTGTVQAGAFQGPNGQIVKYYTRIDLANPDLSSAVTEITVGESGVPIVIPGVLQGNSYYYGRALFSADGNTMYVFAVDGLNYQGSGTYDPSAVTTRFVAIDLTTGAALAAPVEVGGVPVNNYYNGYYGTVGSYIMSTKQYAADGSVSTRLVFVDPTTNVLSSLDIPGEGPRSTGNGPGSGEDYSLRVVYRGTTAVQATVVDDGTGGPAIRLTLVDLTTGQIVGTPVVLAGAERGYTFDYVAGARYYELTTTAAAGDGAKTTTLTVLDTSSGAPVGIPVTMRGDVYREDFNTDRTQLYVTTQVANADGTFSYLLHIVPTENPAAATVVEALVA